jgi:hypothetical protein
VKLYVPSWNGDFRLEDDGKNGTRLVLHQPTPLERKIVGIFLHEAGKKKWTAERPEEPYQGKEDEVPQIAAPLAKTSKLLIKLTRPKRQTLTAVAFSDGKLSVIEGADDKALTEIEKVVGQAAASENKDKPAKAASVRRHTPCCPKCVVGSVAPASEVLLEFLNPEEHESWARQRAIVVTGGLTGHRYVLAHRRSPIAATAGKMCFDIDDGDILHFHDNSVPPEEEVLAAKLILEHREDWLRNEATTFGSRFRFRFKNPFGDLGDGMESTAMNELLGAHVRGLYS